MNYQYIEQLLERYWQCETTREEEQILRTFFNQKDVPAALLPYKDLFTYEQTSVAEETLGDDFDEKMLQLAGEEKPVKARTIHLTERLKPLFKAVAVVAVILTLGNAVTVALRNTDQPVKQTATVIEEPKADGVSVAKVDSVKRDSVAQIPLSIR